MKKRMVALLLGAMMLTSSLSVVVSAEESAAGDFAGTELTIAVLKRNADTAEEFNNDKTAVKMVEEATGIHVNWIYVDEAVMGERVNVMLAEEEQPDAYLGLLTDDQLLVNSSMFYDISEEGLLETYAPNIMKMYEEIKNDGADVLGSLTLSDGSIRSLATNSAASPTSDAAGIWFINKAWLDQLGLEIPTTAEEFYNVLCAFKENDMNGNGEADEIPMSFCNADINAHIYQFVNSFGIHGNKRVGEQYPFLNLNDGKVESTVDTAEWREYLEFYNKLISENLVDKEGFSQSTEQFNAKIAENKVGVYSGWTPAVGEGLDYVCLRPFQGMEGVDVVKSGNNAYYFGKLSGFVPTTDCENIEALLTWWDCMHSSEEIIMSAYCGDEGIAWELAEDGNYYDDYSTDEKQANSNFVSMGTNASPHRSVRLFTGKKSARYALADEVRDLLVDYANDIPIKLVDPLMVEERTFIEADLFGYINNFAAESMMNGVTDESWDAYVAGLEDYQYSEWINWYQSYVNGEF